MHFLSVKNALSVMIDVLFIFALTHALSVSKHVLSVVTGALFAVVLNHAPSVCINGCRV